MAIYRFTIKGCYYGKNRTFPGLNEYLHECSRHPQAGARMKRQYQTIAINAIRFNLKRAKALPPIQIHYDFYETDKKRDKMNIFSFADKIIEDALQVTKFIQNDGWNEIAAVTSEFYVDRKNPRIEITITEVES